MSNNLHSDAPILPYFVAIFEGRAVTIRRDANYEATIKHLQKSIPKLQSAEIQNISISTKLPKFDDILVRISEETWPDLVDQVEIAEIALEDNAKAAGSSNGIFASENKNQGPILLDENRRNAVAPLIQNTLGKLVQTSASNGLNKLSSSATDRFPLTVQTTSGAHFQLTHIHRSSSVRGLITQIENKYGLAAALQRIHFLGKPLDDEQILEQVGITNGSVVDLVPMTRKTLVYCLAPRHNTLEKFPLSNLKVELVSNRCWELAALASSGESEQKLDCQYAYWHVDAADDGALWNRLEFEELQCILWDGVSHASRSTQCSTLKYFVECRELSHSKEWIKSMASVDPQNAVAVPFQQLESYISNVLSAAGFEYASKFFELFQSHLQPKSATNVAVRFLRQADSEKLSYLKVTPSPQNIVRITMLYKWLDSESDDLAWRTSALNPMTGPEVWKEMGGTEVTGSQANRDVFSVYEITWLEVL